MVFLVFAVMMVQVLLELVVQSAVLLFVPVEDQFVVVPPASDVVLK